MHLQHIAQDLAEEFAPFVIGQSGTTKTFTAEQASALYKILVSCGYPDEVPNNAEVELKEVF
ncbi:hypothetical protein D3C81_2013500 [compost metagenome]